MKEYFVYIMFSKRINKYYAGSTNNLTWRLERHNLGWGKFTRRGIPWELVYYEKFDSKAETLKRERAIKSTKSKVYIEKLVNAGGRPERNSGSLVGPALVKPYNILCYGVCSFKVKSAHLLTKLLPF